MTRFYIISIEDHGPRTETVTIERPAPVTTEELALNYGVDFPGWETEWREQMYRKPSGLSILYGPPGCGKTSYLRALMARLLDKAVFYYVLVPEVEMLTRGILGGADPAAPEEAQNRDLGGRGRIPVIESFRKEFASLIWEESSAERLDEIIARVGRRFEQLIRPG